MAFLKTLARGTIKLLLGLLLLLTGFYLILLAINWQDAEPNAASLHMQSLLQQEQIPAEKNGYNHLIAYHANSQLQLSEPLQQLHSQCSRQQNCTELLVAQTNLAELIASQHQLQAFYQQLLKYSQWQEPLPNLDELPYYQIVLHGQRLLLWQAWLDASHNRTDQVKTALQADYQFWKNVLANNNSLIAKMISTAALKQHFNLGPVIVRQLLAEQRKAVVPAAWAIAFSDRELSLEQAMAGEWHLINRFNQSFKEGDEQAYYQQEDNLLETGFMMLLRPLLLLEDSKNITAMQLLRYARDNEQPERPWYSWLRNPVGRLLMEVGVVSSTDYQQRVLELEQQRQAVLGKIG